MKISFFLLTTLILCNCNQFSSKNENYEVKNKEDSIQIKGEFTNKINEESINLLFLNDFYNNSTFNFYRKDSSKFGLSIPTLTPVFLLDWSLNQTYYLLYPGEKVVITPANDSSKFLKMKSSIKDRDEELSFFEKLGIHDISFYFKYPSEGNRNKKKQNKGDLLMAKLRDKKSANPGNSIVKFSDYYQSRKKFLLNYKIENHLTDKFVQIIENYLKYDYLTDILETLNNTNNRSFDNKVLSDSAFGHEVFNCDSCLFIPSYKSAIIAYSHFLMKRENITKLSDSFNIIRQAFKSISREFLLFLTLKKEIEKVSKIDTALVKAFKSINSNTMYSQYIEENLNYLNNVEKSRMSYGTILMDKAGNQFSLQQIMEKNRGKVIYIDVWASWCKPCIYELPFSIKLTHKFAKNNIKFIYLSMDKYLSDWKGSGDEILFEKDNYIVLDNFNSPFAKKLKILSLPRYILIDDQSSIITAYAPRPSDKKITQLLSESLDQ